jgi:sporulation protein YlmC with PRC-barrel domain
MAKTLYIGDLLSSKIVTSEGEKIGHVVDLEITPDQEHKVTALVYGWNGWLFRWHVLHPFAEKFGLRFKPNTVPWDAVDRFEHLTITLKPGREPKPSESPDSSRPASIGGTD